LRYLDQRALPSRTLVCDANTVDAVIDAIRTLAIRGAPAIGVGAAIGLVAALAHVSDGNADSIRTLLPDFASRIAAARPTAVNLAWAVDRMVRRAAQAADEGLLDALRSEADDILQEDIRMCERIGDHGVALIPDGARILTHCNAGALATAGIGTALAPLYVAHAAGRRITVYADETRPLRQGARLTAWELQRAGISVTVLPDGAAASLLASGLIDLVIVGADRIAANGDVANKIGTYGVALAAHAHGVPFYVAAPWSTVDARTSHGAAIAIEHRSAGELDELPDGVGVWNPAFDITPRQLIAAYITDRGLMQPPFTHD
jgi:methylthioribose-1-phosphate isomerase